KYDFKNDIVQSIAGNDIYGSFTEGGVATETSILAGYYLYQDPTSITIDDKENIYMACEGDLLSGSIIRKVSPQGYITTYAGISTPGFSGDGGLATHAKLNQPKDIVVDKRGNMFIADDFNNRIRKVDKNGFITTYAGTGVSGSDGDGGLAINAKLNHPTTLAIDKTGNVYLCDNISKTIREIDTSGIIKTYFTQQNKPFGPYRIAIDSNNNVYLMLTPFNNTLYKVISPTELQTVISDPLLIAGYLAIDNNQDIFSSGGREMQKIFTDGSGFVTYLFGTNSSNNIIDSVYASDANMGESYPDNYPLNYNKADNQLYFGTYGQIYRLDQKNNLLLLVAGDGEYASKGDSGSAKNASFVLSDFVFDKNKNLILSDYRYNNIRKIDTSGIINTIAGKGKGYTGDGGLAINARFNGPSGIIEDKKGNIFIADKYNNSIRRIDAETSIITTYAGNGQSGYSGDGGPATEAELNQPDALAFDSNGNLFIADTKNHLIRKVDTAGKITSLPQKATFYDIAIDQSNTLYYNNGTYIYKVNPNGSFTKVAGSDSLSYIDGAPALQTPLIGSYSIAVDNNNDLYIAARQRIKKLVFGCSTKHITASSSLKYKYVNKPELIYDECNVICSIEPRGNRYDMLNSIVKSQVTIKSSVIKHDQSIFVRRYYTLIPELKLKSCKSKLTLYFTVQDFHNFNLNRGNQNRLPYSDTDLAAIKNIRIFQTFDSSMNNHKIIDPADNDITWNDSLDSWQISFDVTGLGGFYLTTNSSNTSADIATQNLASHSTTNVSIKPNPANNFINIIVDKSFINTTALLMDVNGRLIQNIKLNASNSSINISSFANGVYFIKFVDGRVYKVIKG
ncbi:MAG: T9SS type A sorting domain-containing protein, partial [Parafilimonas sp.]